MTLSNSTNPLIIIDAHNLCWIAYHSMGELDYHGLRTGVAFQFMKDVLKYVNKFNASGVVFCWDSRKSYRKKIYPEYKENRNPPDQDPQEIEKRQAALVQFRMLRREVLPELGFKNIFQRSGYEADDLIAIVTENIKENFVIISSDKDMLQLLDFHVKMYSPQAKKEYTKKEFEKDFEGLHPAFWVKIKSMAGCQTDNVKGIEGVGDITAFKHCKGYLKETTKTFKRIESKEGRTIIKRNVKLVKLPFRGPRPFELPLQKDRLMLTDFIDTFDRLGFGSFLTQEGLAKWKKHLKLRKSMPITRRSV